MGIRSRNYLAVKPEVANIGALVARLKKTGEDEPMFDDIRGSLFLFETNITPMWSRGSEHNCMDLENELELQRALSKIGVENFHLRRTGMEVQQRGEWHDHPFKQVGIIEEINREYYLSVMDKDTCVLCCNSGVVENADDEIVPCPVGCKVPELVTRAMQERMFDTGVPLGLCDSIGKEFKIGDLVRINCTVNQEIHGEFACYRVQMVGGVPVLLYEVSEKGQIIPKGYTGQPLSHLYDTEAFMTTQDSNKLRPSEFVMVL